MKMNYSKAGTFTFACLFLLSFGYELNYWLRPMSAQSQEAVTTIATQGRFQLIKLKTNEDMLLDTATGKVFDFYNGGSVLRSCEKFQLRPAPMLTAKRKKRQLTQDRQFYFCVRRGARRKNLGLPESSLDRVVVAPGRQSFSTRVCLTQRVSHDARPPLQHTRVWRNA
ncbi:MAG: hypothetical protein WAN10_04195 [Candidatus Acidiferrales bacterium]